MAVVACIAVSLSALLVLLLCEMQQFRLLGGLAKMIASTAFIAVALFAGAWQTPVGLLILAGLFFSWWGDLFLIAQRRNIFLLGIGSFFLGHVAYAAAFALHGVEPRWTLAAAAVMLAPAMGVLFWLRPNVGDLAVPVYAYIVIISLMVALSAGAAAAGGTALFLGGAVLFYVSDLFVARERFIHSAVINRLVGLPLYYGGQLVLAYAVYPYTAASAGLHS